MTTLHAADSESGCVGNHTIGISVPGKSLERRLRKLFMTAGWRIVFFHSPAGAQNHDILVVDSTWLSRIRHQVPTVVLTCGEGISATRSGTADIRAVVDRYDLDESFLHAVREVASGHGWISPTLVRPLLGEPVAPPRPRTAPGLPVTRLTAREREVMSLVISGMSNGEIAGALHITESTVKFHVSNVLHKTGLRSRGQLTARRPETAPPY